MATIAVSQVKLGDKIIQDVHTPLGSVLLQKGKIVTPRELDILFAFLVPSVAVHTSADNNVEEEAVPDKTADTPKESPVKTPFKEQYDRTVALIRKVFNQMRSGLSFPILDVRKQLELLLQHIAEYNILTFAPYPANNEDYLYHKSVMSAMSCYYLAQWNGFPRNEWMQAALAGLLHDIGNMKVDQSILTKPTKLTAAEMEEMKRHTVLGYQMLKNIAALTEGAKLAALQHHERIDGSGYPLGLGAQQIHPFAKLVAISDIFNAMTRQRVYQKENSPYVVLEQLEKDSFGKLEPAYVRTFIEKVTQFHNGMIVRLSDNRVGEIVFSDRNHPTRPWVSVNGSIINLATERQYYIEEIMIKR